MAAEAGVNDELFAVAWFAEFEEEDALIAWLAAETKGKSYVRTDDRSYMLIARSDSSLLESSRAMT